MPELGKCLECGATWDKDKSLPECSKDELGRDMSWCSEKCHEIWCTKHPELQEGWVSVKDMDIDELKAELEKVGLTIALPN